MEAETWPSPWIDEDRLVITTDTLENQCIFKRLLIQENSALYSKKPRKYIFQRLLVCKELIDIKIEIDEKSLAYLFYFFQKKPFQNV